MLIKVAFDGKKLFEWEGDTDAVKRIDRAVADLAELLPIPGAKAKDLSQPTLAGILKNGGFFTNKHQAEMMIVIWTVIELSAGQGRPGRIRDYLEAWDFEIDVLPGPTEFEFEYVVSAIPSAPGSA